MKRGNVSIFIPHNGCPHRCSFCNQKNITGQTTQPTAADVRAVLDRAAADLGEEAANAEIAFFGGSFTALDRDYMLSLLKAAQPYLDRFYGIRLSTRPDYIDEEVLDILKANGVTAVELGAQSMDDHVLTANERGHTADDVRSASGLIMEYGFSLGLQMMTGLYGSTPEKDMLTAEEFVKLRPDTVRIYPTVIMRGTALAELYEDGRFVPYTLDESVELCSKLILLFAKADIKLLRLGLHYSESLERESLGGNYHPAFKELCESKIFFDSFLEKARSIDSKRLTVTVNPRSLSKFLGQKKSNLKRLGEMGYELSLKFDDTLEKYDLGVCNATEIT